MKLCIEPKTGDATAWNARNKDQNIAFFLLKLITPVILAVNNLS